MNSSDVIKIVQPYFAGRLQSLEYFGDILVAAPRLWKEGEKLHTPKSILEAVNNALGGLKMTGGKCGATVRVFQPTITVTKPDGRVGSLSLVCRVEVNPTINWGPRGTQKYAQNIAYEVLRHGTGFTILNGFCNLRAEGDCFLPYTNEELNYETVDVILQANVAISPPSAVVMPQLAQGPAGLVTLTNVTAGATIYYSLDSNIFPGPLTAGAVPYTVPFNVAAGSEVIWAAYLPGLAGSNVGFQTINY